MTDSSPLLTTGRRQRMRHLGASDLLPDPDPAPRPVLTGGRAPTEQAFTTGLGQAVLAIAGTDETIVVFRSRARPVRLHQWSEPAGPSSDELDRAVEDQLLAVDPSLVIVRRGGDVVGFASQRRSAADAERLGGALASALTMIHDDESPIVGLSSRLGLAVVEGRRVRPSRTEAAVAKVLAAVERTVALTSDETPYLVHNDFVDQRSDRSDDVARALLPALSERQITLEFQPRFGVAGGLTPVGLEVFPRWRHPELGPVPTIDFLRVAERDGLLGRLGRQVRADAAAMARRWAADGTLGQRRLWFDLAPIELVDRRFLEEITALVSATPRLRVGIELADAPVLEERVLAPIFEALEALDVQLALDNLRPATLSLGRIQRLPVNAVNIDREIVRSLVDDSGQRDLVRLLCGYANDRGIAVTACQVETAEELALVTGLGVDEVQGYAVSVPLAEADLWPHLDRPTR